LWKHFMDRYFPYKPPEAAAVSSAAKDAQTVSGYYMTSRRAQSTFVAATNSFGEVRVVPDSEGTIKVFPFKDFNGQIRRWKEIGPLVYREVNSQDRIAFVKDTNGRLELRVNFPAIVFQRTGWLDSSPWNRFVIYYTLTILILTLVLWPVAWVVRRHYGFKLDLTSAQQRLRIAIKMVCAIELLFVVGLAIIFSVPEDLTFLSGKLDPWIVTCQVVGLIGAAGTLLVIYATLRLWRRTNIWRGVRWLNLLIVLACIGFTWFVVHWNMINFNMSY